MSESVTSSRRQSKSIETLNALSLAFLVAEDPVFAIEVLEPMIAEPVISRKTKETLMYALSRLDGHPEITIHKADFTGFQLPGIVLRNIKFINCIFNDADFDNARFEGVDFISSNFENTYLRDTVFNGVDIRGSFFTGLKLRHTKFVELRNFDKTNFNSSELQADLNNSIENMNDITDESFKQHLRTLNPSLKALKGPEPFN